MTSNLGIIEWLPNTQTIKEFIERELFNPIVIKETQEEHDKWAREHDKWARNERQRGNYY